MRQFDSSMMLPFQSSSANPKIIYRFSSARDHHNMSSDVTIIVTVKRFVPNHLDIRALIHLDSRASSNSGPVARAPCAGSISSHNIRVMPHIIICNSM